jgi:hypothetical protein
LRAINRNTGAHMSNTDTSRLEDFYSVYAPRMFPAARTRRGKQNLAKKLRLPLIRAGNTTLIDPSAGDARLRELAIGAQPLTRRGRPRTS